MRPSDLGSFRWWVYPVLLAVAAFCFDAANRLIRYGPISAGPLDEPAHLAIAALGLLVVARFIEAPRRFYVAALIASVAIDLDHIPLYLGWLGPGGQRPVTHSLATVVVLAIAAVASRRHRAVLTGVVVGLLLHFARDIAEGPPGVRMLWPIQQTAWIAGYGGWLGMILVFLFAELILGGLKIPRGRRRVFDHPDGHLRPAAAEPATDSAPSTDSAHQG
ncbi:MAG: metal-dependent hydrolase [Streptosporangiaceae bacterium]|jgi:hypothetical protein